MTDDPPELIALDPDASHAEYVGRTADERQFFVTSHVYPECPADGHAFVAVYLFNVAGKLLEARIEDLGPRAEVGPARWMSVTEQRFRELGSTMPCRIVMAPFEVERLGV